MSFFTSLENFFKKEGTVLENIFAGIFAELKPTAEQDLKDVVSVGLAAGLAAFTGGPITLTAVEAAALIGARAMLPLAASKGVQLSEQTGIALAAAAGISLPAHITAPLPAAVAAPLDSAP